MHLQRVSSPEENPYLPPSTPSQPPAVVLSGPADGRLRDNRTLGWVVVGLILGNALMRTFNDVLASLVNSGILEANTEFLSFLDIIRSFVGVLFVIAVVFHCIWIYRTAVNAQRINGVPLGITPGMAVACYFIPIYLIFGPCVSMREMVRISFRNHPGRSVLSWVVPWWIAYFSSPILNSIVSATAELSFLFYFRLVLWDLAAALISYIIIRLSAVQAETVVTEITPQSRGRRPSPNYATLPPRS